MKIAIVGSRNFKYLDIIEKYMLKQDKNTEFVSGGAFQGADKVCKDVCLKNNLKYKEFLPNIKLYPKGNTRYYQRNKEIVLYADKIKIWYDGFSRGSKLVIDLCKKYNKDYQIITERDIDELNYDL